MSDPELMTRHSANDTELFRKMTSFILMDKISPYGRCHMRCCHPGTQSAIKSKTGTADKLCLSR